jgi:hypothetical protein
MNIQFSNYFNFNIEIRAIRSEKATLLEIIEKVSLIAFKIISYLTIIIPIFCFFGYLAQKKIRVQVENPPQATEKNTPQTTPQMDKLEKIDEKPPIEIDLNDRPKEVDEINQIRDDFSKDRDIQLERLTIEMVIPDHYKKNYRNTGYFILFIRFNQPSEFCKFHISLDRKSPKFAEANRIIAKLLFENNINSFKFVNPELEEDEIKGTNVEGKEFCVYLERSEFENSRELIKKINEELKKIGIERGKPSRGDLLLGQDGFCYSRNPNNFFGNYLSADYLMAAGFTSLESAYISTGGLLGDLKLLPKVDNLTTFNNLPKNLSKDLIEKFVESFERDCFSAPGRVDFVGALWLVLGDLAGSKKYACPQNLEIIFPVIYNDAMKNTKSLFWNIPSFMEDSMFTLAEFNRIFNEAAACLVYEFEKRKISIENAPGGILPAIYHAILAPLAQTFLSKEKKEEKIGKVVDFLSTQKDKIVEYIVSCGLRDRSKIQIEREEPILLGS